MKLSMTMLAGVSVAALLAGCTGSSVGSAGPGGGALPPFARSHRHTPLQSGVISHVVIIVQENRTVDDLFQFLPGANTQSWGYNASNRKVNLYSTTLTINCDMDHTHTSFVDDYAQGQLNGWNKNDFEGGHCPGQPSYQYIPQADVQPYYTMAETYTFADDLFQTNQGPSSPAHLYLVAGTSAVSNGSDYLVENLANTGGGGCDHQNATVQLINVETGDQSQHAKPCVNINSLMTLLEAQGLTWKYYQAVGGPTANQTWNAPDWVYPIWDSPEFSTDVSYPSSNVLTDIANGNLANVVWVTPTEAASDHPRTTDGSGPSWVASIVNAIGESPYWNSTAIFITWDDWGGLYDHVVPPVRNYYELGFRVPLIVVSPYAKAGYVSHVQHEFGSILHFTEEAFGLPSLGTTDGIADDLSDCFDFSLARTRFTPIAAPLRAEYFLKHAKSSGPPDND